MSVLGSRVLPRLPQGGGQEAQVGVRGFHPPGHQGGRLGDSGVPRPG